MKTKITVPKEISVASNTKLTREVFQAIMGNTHPSLDDLRNALGELGSLTPSTDDDNPEAKGYLEAISSMVYLLLEKVKEKDPKSVIEREGLKMALQTFVEQKMDSHNLARILSISKREARRQISALKKIGAIRFVPKYGRQGPPVYQITEMGMSLAEN